MIVANYLEEELEEIARMLLINFNKIPVWLFIGEMGVGKTTLIKQICQEAKVIDQMSSPTFSIVNEYQLESGDLIYHMDLYRINDIDEAITIGIEDYLYSGNLCLIEWPELIEELLPKQCLKININLAGDIYRSLTAQPT